MGCRWCRPRSRERPSVPADNQRQPLARVSVDLEEQSENAVTEPGSEGKHQVKQQDATKEFATQESPSRIKSKGSISKKKSVDVSPTLCPPEIEPVEMDIHPDLTPTPRAATRRAKGKLKAKPGQSRPREALGEAGVSDRAANLRVAAAEDENRTPAVATPGSNSRLMVARNSFEEAELILRVAKESLGNKEQISVVLDPGIEHGLILRVHKVLAVTRSAPDELRQLCHADCVAEINGLNVRGADADFLQGLLNSVFGGHESFTLTFERAATDENTARQPPPSFMRDQRETGGAEWFAYWDLGNDDRLDFETIIHAIDVSFQMNGSQYAAARCLVKECWPTLDPLSQGLSFHQCVQPNGLFALLCSATFHKTIRIEADRRRSIRKKTEFSTLGQPMDEVVPLRTDGSDDMLRMMSRLFLEEDTEENSNPLTHDSSDKALGDVGRDSSSSKSGGDDDASSRQSAKSRELARQQTEEASRREQELRHQRMQEEANRLLEEKRKAEEAQEEERRRAEEARVEAAAKAMAVMKEKLRSKVRTVCDTKPCNSDKLRELLGLCDEAGLGDEALVVDARALLEREHVKLADPVLKRLLLQLNTALAGRPANLQIIETVIDEVEKSGRLPEEVVYARALVASKQEKQVDCRFSLKDTVERLRGIERSYGKADVCVISNAVNELKDVIAAALDSWLPESEVAEADFLRRVLHNALQDLKGAIRVYCRVRPPLPREKNANVCIDRADTMTVEVRSNGPKPGSTSVTSFIFDAVFPSGCSQEEVFHDCSDLVQSAIDGHNITIFAYGQTGAGKTFTMYGDEAHPGITPRATKAIFAKCKDEADRFKFVVKASMVELYNNEIRDLLVEAKRKYASSDEKPKLRMDETGAIVLKNVIEKVVTGEKALCKLLDAGYKGRATSATAMNAESSRSHLIIVVTVETWNRQTGAVVTSKLTLVDLAGSERVKKSEVSGEAMKEAIEINKSLTALGDVVQALTQGAELVPYRNHKLTQLLQSALSGTSKTLMFVNISPMDTSVDETIMSLKYAQRAKSTIGKDAASGGKIEASKEKVGKAAKNAAKPVSSPKRSQSSSAKRSEGTATTANPTTASLASDGGSGDAEDDSLQQREPPSTPADGDIS